MAAYAAEVTVIRPNRGVRAAYAIPAFLGTTLAAVTAWAIATGNAGPGFGEFVPAMFMMTMLSTAAVAAAVRFNLGSWSRRESIEADPEGVKSGGALLLSRDAIVDGYQLAYPNGSMLVRLVGKRRVPLLSVVVASTEEAEALLSALELGVRHRVLSVATFVKVGGNNFPAKIMVGADGVLVRYPGPGFVSYADIEGVDRTQTGGTIHRRGGADPIHYATMSLSSAALTGRIEEGLLAHRRAEPADVAALVARGSRPAPEWLATLRTGATERGFRSADVPDEDLWRVAEDPTAIASARAGAAVVLRTRGGPASRARIEAAAAATAHPRMRVALEAAAKEDDDELCGAIDDAAEPTAVARDSS